jgi:hypothetical protein
MHTTARLSFAHYVVLFSLAALITIRFFTEELHVLPRALNLIDIPLLFLVTIEAVIQRSASVRHIQRSTFFTLLVPFLAILTISTLVNFNRVDIFPALTFVYGFLGPLAFYLGTYKLWEPGPVRAVSNLLVSLAVVQFCAIVLYDVPQFLRTRNPDVISGTFGTNAYQLVFFLLVFVALIVGIVAFEPTSRIRFFALPFIASAFVAIFLAQYRTLLVTTVASTVFVGVLVCRRQRGALIGALALVGVLASLIAVTTYFPQLKFNETVDALRSSPGLLISGRLNAADDVYRMYGDDWAFPLIGTGPGTYSSRAWSTYTSYQSASDSNVAGTYIQKLFGDEPYQTDVSTKYLIPRLSEPAVLGSHSVTAPFSSYLALIAEVGILGGALLIAAYFIATARATRAAFRLSLTAPSGDPLPALVVTTATAFFTLLQMAIFGNWFEVARVTLPTWILYAIITRELQARKDFKGFKH